MKKRIHLVGLTVALVMLLWGTVLPICANAQQTGETNSATVSVYVQSGASFAENETVSVTFSNTATDEEYEVSLKAGDKNNTVELPKGTYRVVKACLQKSPVVVFETSVGELVIDDSENIFYTLSLKGVLTTAENEDEVNSVISELEKKGKGSGLNFHLEPEQLQNFLLALGMLVWLALMIVSVTYTVKSKRRKYIAKRELLKEKGKLLRHILLGIMAGTCVGLLAGGKEGISWIGAVIGFGIPFGVPAVAMFMIGDDDARSKRDDDADGNSAVFFMVIATAIGIFLAPIVLTFDIIHLVRASRDYKAWLKQG